MQRTPGSRELNAIELVEQGGFAESGADAQIGDTESTEECTGHQQQAAAQTQSGAKLKKYGRGMVVACT